MKRLAYAVLLLGGGDDGAPSLPAGVECLVSGDLGLAYTPTDVGALATTIPRLEAAPKNCTEQILCGLAVEKT